MASGGFCAIVYVMVYAPYYTDEMLGSNPFPSNDPIIVEGAGTPRAIIAIPVDARKTHIMPASRN